MGYEGEFESGSGTFVRNGNIYASRVGTLTMDNKKALVSPRRPTCVPTVGSTVLARVTKANPRYIGCEIHIVNETPSLGFKATLKQAQIRKTEVETLNVYDCFKVGDVIRARVMDLGDSSVGYLLRCDDNVLGVVLAKCECGAQMVPISWEQMKCPKDGKIENRKCAKTK